jgi:hypothetical protein
MRFPIWHAAAAGAVAILALTGFILTVLPAQATIGSGNALPPGYRNWKLVSVAILGPPNDDIRAILGNDVAIGAFRKGKIPFPDGAIIARLAWKQVKDPEGNNALTHEPLSPDSMRKLLSGTFAAGPATNVQFMLRDSRKYAATGGWGFAQFTNGKPDAILQHSCWDCHALAGNRGFVFTRYSP